MSCLKFSSTNIVEIIEKILSDNDLVKHIYYKDEPSSQADLPDNSLLFKGDYTDEANPKSPNIYPYPFSTNISQTPITTLHVYFPSFRMEDSIVANGVVFFDIMCHKELWMYKDNGEKLLRPYNLADKIMDLFRKSFGKVGVMDFFELNYIASNGDYNGVRLVAEIKSFDSESKESRYS